MELSGEGERGCPQLQPTFEAPPLKSCTIETSWPATSIDPRRSLLSQGLSTTVVMVRVSFPRRGVYALVENDGANHDVPSE